MELKDLSAKLKLLARFIDRTEDPPPATLIHEVAVLTLIWDCFDPELPNQTPAEAVLRKLSVFAKDLQEELNATSAAPTKRCICRENLERLKTLPDCHAHHAR